MYVHRMSQSEKETVGCELLCMLQYLWDMNICYDYVHRTYNGTYVEVRHSNKGILATNYNSALKHENSESCKDE